MKTISDQDLLALEAKHGQICLVSSEQGDLVLRRPSKAEFKSAWAKGVFDLKLAVNYDALERLVHDLCVFPEQAELARMLDAAPGMLLLCLDPVVKLSGMVQRDRDTKSPGADRR